MQSSEEPGTSRAEPTSHVSDGVSLVSGTLQSSPATTSPSGSLSGSQDDSDSDMAFSVNQSSSASESSLGKDVWSLGGAGKWAALEAVSPPRPCPHPRALSWREEEHLDAAFQRVITVLAAWGRSIGKGAKPGRKTEIRVSQSCPPMGSAAEALPSRGCPAEPPWEPRVEVCLLSLSQ